MSIPAQATDIGPVHVLFLPVGGFYTVGPDQARSVMESLKPRMRALGERHR